MATGTVKWFNSTKGYGFINPDDDSKDVFVHVSELENIEHLDEAQKVSFELTTNKGKTAAANVALMEG